MVSYKVVTIIKSKLLRRKGWINMMTKVLTNTVAETAKIATEVSKASYLSQKKKNPKEPSKIIDSFKTNKITGSHLSATAVVFAGGPNAPHAIYVDQPHLNRGGKSSFRGYKFMEKGALVAQKEMPLIALKNFNKIFKGV